MGERARARRGAALATALALLAPLAAAASPMIVLRDLRFVHASEGGGSVCALHETPPAPPGSSLLMESRAELWFYVEEPTPFSLDGFAGFLTIDEDGLPNPGTDVEVRLFRTVLPSTSFGPDLALVAWELSGVTRLSLVEGGAFVSFEESGVLLPNVLYTLEVWARSDHESDSVFGAWNFTFMVPEPGTGLLLASGLAWLGARRRGR